MDIEKRIEEIIGRLKEEFEFQKASVGCERSLSQALHEELKALVEEVREKGIDEGALQYAVWIADDSTDGFTKTHKSAKEWIEQRGNKQLNN
jgi:hypothetical protein